jgi:transporter family-2 protein
MSRISSTNQSTLLLGILTLFVGVLQSAQSRANGQLSIDLQNPLGAAIVSNLIGWTLLMMILALRRGEWEGFKILSHAIRKGDLRWWELLAGVGGAYWLSIQTFAVPQIGVAVFTICTVGGQMSSSLIVDKFGLSMNGRQRVTRPRFIAALTTLIAVTIAVFPDLQNATFRASTILLSFSVGIFAAVQFALMSRVNQVTKRPLVTTWVNFFVGTSILSIALGINLIQGGSFGSLPRNFWVYLGGPVGVIFVAVASLVVRHLGVLNFVLFTVTGQLVGALLLDLLIPANKDALSFNLFLGIAMTLASIVFSRYFNTKSMRQDTNQ